MHPGAETSNINARCIQKAFHNQKLPFVRNSVCLQACGSFCLQWGRVLATLFEVLVLQISQEEIHYFAGLGRAGEWHQKCAQQNCSQCSAHKLAFPTKGLQTRASLSLVNSALHNWAWTILCKSPCFFTPSRSSKGLN